MRGRGSGRGGRGRDAVQGEIGQEGEVTRESVKGNYAGRPGRGRGRGPPGKGKRQYDRRDGTGRG